MMQLSESVCCPPILLLLYNRPDLTHRMFRSILEVKPSRLFVAADGPRSNVPEDVDLCERSRQVLNLVDWECEVQTLFRDTNLGCKAAVSSAIDWFFENVDAGIILEDDCIPHPTFFRFCTELLVRYSAEERIMNITGDNFQRGRLRSQYSYYYSRYVHVWGWATWRRAWQHYDGSMERWPTLRNTSWLLDFLGIEDAASYWRQIFDRAHAGKIDSWAYPWTFSCWARSGLSVVPEANLVSNIGFDHSATHTRNPSSSLARLETVEMSFPLKHPPHINREIAADAFTFYNAFRSGSKPNLLSRIRGKVASLSARFGTARQDESIKM